MEIIHKLILSETDSDDTGLAMEMEKLQFRNKAGDYILIGLVNSGWSRYTTRVYVDDHDEITIRFEDNIRIEDLDQVKTYVSDPVLSGRTITGTMRPTIVNDISHWRKTSPRF